MTFFFLAYETKDEDGTFTSYEEFSDENALDVFVNKRASEYGERFKIIRAGWCNRNFEYKPVQVKIEYKRV